MAINPAKFETAQLVVYLILLPMLAVMILPILYIVFTAFKPMGELFAYPPKFITTNPTGDNFRKLFEATENTLFPLSIYLFNSIVSTLIVVGAGIFISVARRVCAFKKKLSRQEPDIQAEYAVYDVCTDRGQHSALSGHQAGRLA